MPGKILLNILLLFVFGALIAQEAYMDENGSAREVVLDQKIKSVQFYREGWRLSYPITRKHDDIPLILEFDELDEQPSSLSYKIVHCNADWSPSQLSEQDYLDGYLNNQISDYRTSFNTYFSYTHYALKLPNEDISFKMSGNYLVVVFRDYNESEIVFTRRFMITEGIVSIEANAHIPDLNMYSGCCQEVDFTVNHSNFPINDPYSEPKVYIYQNGIWDLSINGLQPQMVNSGQLVYDYQDENIFMGGNEFRLFDLKNTRTPTYYIQSIDYVSPYFHFTLKPDEPNAAHLYFSKDDMNGRFYIESEDGYEHELESDYVVVHFQLDMPFPMDGGSVYIAGGLTQWQFTEENRMEYNGEKGAYLKSLLLKQGVYNYRYVFVPDDGTSIDISAIEGSHFETENEYLILFYYRAPGDRYDRLIGHQVARTNTR